MQTTFSTLNQAPRISLLKNAPLHKKFAHISVIGSITVLFEQEWLGPQNDFKLHRVKWEPPGGRSNQDPGGIKCPSVARDISVVE